MDDSAITVFATKPDTALGLKLVGLGVRVLPIDQDELVERYIISSNIAVEYRNNATFLSGIMDKSLFTSAIFLRENYSLPVLIVEGQINYEYTAFNPQAVRGALTSMIVAYGITVVQTPDLDESAATIQLLARQEQIGIPEISLVPKRKAADLPDLQRRLVEMLPGCGRVAARDLLQYFGSIEAIVNADVQAFTRVRGIGLKKARLIHQVLHNDYEAIDTERRFEDAIVADHSLLFEQTVALLDRQHMIFIEGDTRHIADLLFYDADQNTVYLVELKRDRLQRDHEAQLRRYLDNAQRSPLIQGHLAQGAALHGILATPAACTYKATSTDISVVVADEAEVIRILKLLHQQYKPS